ASGRNMVNEFDACDLDNAMAFAWIEAGRFSIQDDFAHQFLRCRLRIGHRRPGAIRDLPSRKLLTTARSRRKLRLRLEPVGTTKSARSRFSRSGIWFFSIAERRLSVMPGLRKTRCRWINPGPETTRTESHRRWLPLSQSRG